MVPKWPKEVMKIFNAYKESTFHNKSSFCGKELEKALITHRHIYICPKIAHAGK